MDASGPTPSIELALRDVAWVQGLARRLAREGEAEDLAQETWLAALEGPGRAQRGLRQWLSGAARNLALRQRRARRPVASDALDQHPGAEGTDELLLRSEFQERVLAAVRQLAEPYRATVLLRYYEGLALDEVARRTGVPSSTARTRLARAQDELRRRLDRECGGREAWCALAVPGAKVTTSIVLGGAAMKAVTVGVGVVLVALAAYIAREARRDEREPEVVRAREEASAGAEFVVEPGTLEPGQGGSSREEREAQAVVPEEPAPEAEAPRPDSASDTVSIRGRVVDPAGQPVRGANLYAIPPDTSDWSTRPDRVSNEQGDFELRGLARGVWKVGAVHGDAPEPAETTVDARHGEVEGVQLVLTLGGCFRGRVSWPDGSPVALGWAQAEVPMSSKGILFRGGVFTLCGLANQEWSLVLTASREGEFGRILQEGLRPDHGDLDLVLESVPTFDVGVDAQTAGGVPVEFILDASFSSSIQRRAKGSGAARLEDLHPGSWRVSLRSIGYRTVQREVELLSSADTLRFSLEPIEPIRGRVLTPDGKAAPGARIVGFACGEEATALSNGSFELACMQGRVSLTATLPGFAPSASVAFEHSGESGADGPVLVLRPACRASGRVLDESGNPLAGATVDSPVFGSEDGLTAPDGTFELVDMPSGSHSLWVTRQDGTKAGPFLLGVSAGGSNAIEIRLPATQ